MCTSSPHRAWRCVTCAQAPKDRQPRKKTPSSSIHCPLADALVCAHIANDLFAVPAQFAHPICRAFFPSPDRVMTLPRGPKIETGIFGDVGDGSEFLTAWDAGRIIHAALQRLAFGVLRASFEIIANRTGCAARLPLVLSKTATTTPLMMARRNRKQMMASFVRLREVSSSPGASEAFVSTISLAVSSVPFPR
mmetsp:Transcript_12876/g.35563  ORF Transcript_12876/g.35563 Transcript_12876/m.35563 type:complete len:193 (-) Transcript_12876:146-724(-)